MNIKSIYKFSENTLSLVSIKTIELGLTIWLIPYLILKVGLTNYGYYAFAMALILFLVNVLNYGFNLSAVREIAKNKHNNKLLSKIVSEVISVKIVLLLVVYSLLLFLIIVIPEFWEHKTLYFFASLILVGELFSLRWFFLGMEQLKFKVFINLANTCINVLLIVVFVQTEDDYTWIPLAEAIALLLVAVSSFIWALRKYNIHLKFSSFVEIKHYLKVNFSAFVNLLVPSTFGTITVFLVGVFGLPAQVGMMQIGVKFTGAFSTINTIFTKVLYPIVNRKKSVMKVSRRVLLVFGIFLSAAMYVSSDFLITNWLKSESQINIHTIIGIVQLLSPMPFVVAIISGYGINGLLTLFKDTLFSYVTVFSTVCMVFLAWLLVPRYEFYGGAISFLASRVVYAILTYLSFKKIVKWN